MSSEEIFKIVVDNLNDIIPDIKHEAITYNSKLCPLGVGSVGRAELIEKMLEDLRLDADRFEFHSASNLGELVDLFSKKLKVKLA